MSALNSLSAELQTESQHEGIEPDNPNNPNNPDNPDNRDNNPDNPYNNPNNPDNPDNDPDDSNKVRDRNLLKYQRDDDNPDDNPGEGSENYSIDIDIPMSLKLFQQGNP